MTLFSQRRLRAKYDTKVFSPQCDFQNLLSAVTSRMGGQLARGCEWTCFKCVDQNLPLNGVKRKQTNMTKMLENKGEETQFMMWQLTARTSVRHSLAYLSIIHPSVP